MEKQQSERSRPQLTLGTLGNSGHGKTTLASALDAVMASQGAARNYAQIDSPTHADYVKAQIVGAAQMDAAILVVSAPDGLTPETREQLLLARQVGVPYVVAFINKADLVDDKELLELIELEIRELLSTYGFPGDNTPVIVGSALKALEGDTSEIGVPSIAKLLEAMDQYIPEPRRLVDQPFLMAVEDAFSISGRGTVATGRIERGTVKVGDEVELVGLRPTLRAKVIGVEMFKKLLDAGQAGDDVGVFLGGVTKEDVERGRVICKPGSILSYTHFNCDAYLSTHEEGGRNAPFFKGYRPQFYFHNVGVTGVVQLPDGVEMAMPGDQITCAVDLVTPVALEIGSRFSIREDSKIIGAGVVRSVSSAAPASAIAVAESPRAAGNAPIASSILKSIVSEGAVGVDDSDARKVSLLFATTRERSDAPGELFSGERAEGTYYGHANVRVPEVRRLGQIPLPFEIKMFSITLYKQTTDPQKHFVLQGCRLLQQDDWVQTVRSSGKHEALVFVHGFNVSFVDAVFRCAQIAWDIGYKGIPILFSWASRGVVLDYGYDRNSALVARKRFVNLLLLLRDAGLERVHVLAHSMGNFAVLDALSTHDHARKPLGLGELLMAAPDVDVDQYKDIAPAVRAAAQGMTLYASSMDRAMVLSRALAGNVARAGDVPAGGPALIDQVDAIDVTAVGDDIFGLNHGVFAAKKSILNDIKLLLARGIRPPSERLAEIRGMPEGRTPIQWWRYVY